MDYTGHGVTKSQTRLSDCHSLTHRIMWSPGLWIDGEDWCGIISAPILWQQCWTTISALELPACCQDLCCYWCSVILFAQPIPLFLILQFWINSVLHRIILVCFQGSLTWEISLLFLIREVSVPDDTAMKWQSLSSSGSVSGTEPCRSEVDMWHKWEINLIVLNHWDLGLLCHCSLTLPVLTNTYILSITHVLGPLGGFLQKHLGPCLQATFKMFPLASVSPKTRIQRLNKRTCI